MVRYMPLLLLISLSISQDLEDLSFGDDNSLDVATWNIEWFPKNNQITVDYVTEIISLLDLDILAIQEIDDILESTGMKVSQCRVRALPLSLEVDEFVKRHDKVIVLEINRDGQMYGILRKELPIALVPKVHSVAYSDGIPPRAEIYAEEIMKVLKEV